jgi:hypothetical protein
MSFFTPIASFVGNMGSDVAAGTPLVLVIRRDATDVWRQAFNATDNLIEVDLIGHVVDPTTVTNEDPTQLLRRILNTDKMAIKVVTS